MNGGETDERVMQRLRGGDESALAELMGRWERPIWAFINRLCGTIRATDDLYQEVWMRLYLYRRAYRPDRPFKPYLFAIAVNCCRRALAGWRAGNPAPADPPASEPVSSDPPPAEAAIAAEQTHLLHRAIARLPEAQRTVVLLHCLMEADYRTVAEATGRSVGTVRSHMHHALRKLRGMLARMSPGLEGEADHERQPH